MGSRHKRGAVLAVVLTLLPAAAFAGPKVVDAKRVFPYLEGYLKLPAAERGRFTVSYQFRVSDQPVTGPMWLVDGASRAPDPLSNGRPARLPTLGELDRAKAEFGLDEATKISVKLSAEPLLRPTAEMDARELTQAVAQAAVGVRKVAGVAGFLAPKVTRVLFEGVSSGEARLADGRRVPLPVEKGLLVFDPAKLPTATTLRFARPPSHVELD